MQVFACKYKRKHLLAQFFLKIFLNRGYPASIFDLKTAL